MLRSRLSAALYLLLVFTSGAILGGFGTRFYMIKRWTAANPRPEEWRSRYVAEIRQRLKLDDQQVQRLEQILDETRKRYHEAREQEKPRVQSIQAEQTEKIRAMLRDDQRPVYEAWRAERDRRRQEFDRKKGPPRKGPPPD